MSLEKPFIIRKSNNNIIIPKGKIENRKKSKQNEISKYQNEFDNLSKMLFDLILTYKNNKEQYYNREYLNKNYNDITIQLKILIETKKKLDEYDNKFIYQKTKTSINLNVSKLCDTYFINKMIEDENYNKVLKKTFKTLKDLKDEIKLI
jgi:hypothetical protein